MKSLTSLKLTGNYSDAYNKMELKMLFPNQLYHINSSENENTDNFSPGLALHFTCVLGWAHPEAMQEES